MTRNGMDRPIGVFDSGMGGISVLKELTSLMPREHFIYYGDNANAPYGVKSEEEIIKCTQTVVGLLLKRDIKALVIACNTATSAAAETLRRELTIPVVGMEPALKPAALSHGRGQILVLATPATLSQRKFNALMERYGQDAVMVPCAGLMEFVERGEFESEALFQYLRERLKPYREQVIDAVVLGCTHYVFLKRAISAQLPGVPLYDGNLGTAKRLRALLRSMDLEQVSGEGSVEFMTSAEESVYLPRMRAYYDAIRREDNA